MLGEDMQEAFWIKNYNLKAFYTLKTLIKETWTTKIQEDINLSEEFNFNGFTDNTMDPLRLAINSTNFLLIIKKKISE